jgi:hypothetical protein
MFILDPRSEFFHPRTVDPGSRSKRSYITIHTKEIFSLQIVSKLSRKYSGMFIPDLDFFSLLIPDPGIKKPLDIGSGSATLFIQESKLVIVY